MAGRIIVETARLILREFAETDIEPLYAMGTIPELLRYTGKVGFRDREHALENLRANPLTDYRTRGFGRWACVLKANGEVIGFAGPKHLPELGEVEIGFRLLPAWWGMGLATEAGKAVLEYGFGALGLRRIIGLVDRNNAASIRVLEKLGMKYVDVVHYRGENVARYAIDAPAHA
jgi:[ribosomal protein S5]-alanine N-acetyltransferase